MIPDLRAEEVYLAGNKNIECRSNERKVPHMILTLPLLAALLEPAGIWEVGPFSPVSSILVFPFSSKMLMPLNITNIIIIAGPQLATARRMAEWEVSVDGAGTTYILFVDPLRIGEYGPLSTEQVRPHVALP